jgi:hypothetical protein
MRLHLNHRVAVTRSPILAKHVPAGVTGRVVEFMGYRAYLVRFDGGQAAYPCFPEDLTRISSDAPTVTIPRKQLAPRGKLATRSN